MTWGGVAGDRPHLLIDDRGLLESTVGRNSDGGLSDVLDVALGGRVSDVFFTPGNASLDVLAGRESDAPMTYVHKDCDAAPSDVCGLADADVAPGLVVEGGSCESVAALLTGISKEQPDDVFQSSDGASVEGQPGCGSGPSRACVKKECDVGFHDACGLVGVNESLDLDVSESVVVYDGETVPEPPFSGWGASVERLAGCDSGVLVAPVRVGCSSRSRDGAVLALADACVIISDD